MPRYHFHRYDDNDTFDIEGRELADVESAVIIGIEAARSMAGVEVCESLLSLDHRLDITNDTGELLVSIHFGEVADVVG